MIIINLPASSGLTLLIVIVHREELPERCIRESFQMGTRIMMMMMTIKILRIINDGQPHLSTEGPDTPLLCLTLTCQTSRTFQYLDYDDGHHNVQ